jgi:hypothetical protein
MNKKNGILVFIIILALSLFACSKRDKLQNSNVLIDIKPNFANLLPQTETKFTATVKSVDGKIIDKQVTWQVSNVNSDDGNDCGNISSAGVYTSPQIASAKTVKISARLDDIVRSVNVRILHELPVKSDRYYFYADEFVYFNDKGEFVSDDSTFSRLKLDITNPGDDNKNGGYLGKIGGSDLVITTDKENFSEGESSVKLAFNNAVTGSGIYFQFGFGSTANPGNPKITDLSTYVAGCNTVKFFFKAEGFNTSSFLVKIVRQQTEISKEINPNEYLEWKQVTFKSNVILTDFKQLVFVTKDATTSGSFYIDDIYFCKT